MLLYHSFPRKALADRSISDANELGIRQLAMMLEHGLLLTPESLFVPKNKRAANHDNPKTCFLQTRACFTLASQEELWREDQRRTSHGKLASHAELFGEFAIGLNPVRARALGAVPVMYFYSDRNEVNVSYEILFRLRELRSLAIALARLEAKAGIPERDVLDAATLDKVGYLLKGDPIVERRISKVDAQTARTAIELLDTDRPPAWNLVDWIDILLDFFQTADSHDAQGSLAYYQQREWRIVRAHGPHVRCYRLALDCKLDAQSAMCKADRRLIRKNLKCLNRDFFTDDCLENSAILQGTDDESFFDFVQEIICPVTVSCRVADLLAVAKANFSHTDLCVASRQVSIFTRNPR